MRVSLEDVTMKTLPFFYLSARALVAMCLFAGFSTVAEPAAIPVATATESGTASYYADAYHGRPTASGEKFDMHQLTAAHPRLKFGTLVRVTNTVNQRSVLVRINDRGPFVAGRVIDVSLAAAEKLEMQGEPVTVADTPHYTTTVTQDLPQQFRIGLFEIWKLHWLKTQLSGEL